VTGAEHARRLTRAIKAEGGQAIAIKADVSKPGQVRAMVKRTIVELGPPDILVNNAGIEKSAALVDVTDDEWGRIIAVNLSGAFYCLRECARVMQKSGGSIVNISSVHEDLEARERCKPPEESLERGILPHDVEIPGARMEQEIEGPLAEDLIRDVTAGTRREL
jgi:NAD(P)-dependent dehydrogenase (short-subunit alcohol dehydrogenase family)